MKILLIQPPVRDFYQTEIRIQPIGLTYLASSLLKEGLEVEILDCQVGKSRQTLPFPSTLNSLKKYYDPRKKEPFKLFNHFYHFGLLYHQIEQRIAQSAADIIGISSMFTPYEGEAFQIAGIAKKLDPRRPVIIGGAHVSSCAERVIQSNHVDYIITGEGEERLVDLTDALRHGKFGRIEKMDGVGYKSKNKLTINPPTRFIVDLDTLPFPARHLMNLENYKIGRKRSTMLITSRGCPHFCKYCAVHLHMGREFRTRSPENVMDEIIHCYRDHGITSFDIEDDNFTFDKARAERILDLIIEHFGERQLTLMAMNGLSVHSLDQRLLAKMKRAGFINLNLSLASNLPKVRQALTRPGTTEEVSGIVSEAHRQGFPMVVYAILGLPDQTIGEMIATIVHVMEMPAIIGPSVFYPVPGTRFFQECLERDVIKEGDYFSFRSTAFPLETEEFSKRDLITLFQLVRIINFLKELLDLEAGKSGSMEAGGLSSFNSSGFLNSRPSSSLASEGVEQDGGEVSVVLSPNELFSAIDRRGISCSLTSRALSSSEPISWTVASPLTRAEMGIAVLSLFLESHIYYSLVIDEQGGAQEGIKYTLVPVDYSAEVIDSFFDKAKGKIIAATSNKKLRLQF